MRTPPLVAPWPPRLPLFLGAQLADLDELDPACILLDLDLPDGSDLAVLKAIREKRWPVERRIPLPVIPARRAARKKRALSAL